MGYEVVGVLGRGGTAVVELALDGSGSWVATKRVALTGSAAQLHVARQRLRREAEILRNLACPGIVPIIDVIEDGSDVVLVFPPFQENLEDRVARLGPLSPDEVERFGSRLAGSRGRCPPSWGRASRYQAGERVVQRRRRAGALRLRRGRDGRGHRRAHASGHGDRHADVDGARTGTRRTNRTGQRRFLAGRHPAVCRHRAGPLCAGRRRRW